MYTKEQMNRLMGGFLVKENFEIKPDKKGCYDLIGPKVININKMWAHSKFDLKGF